MFKSTKKLIKNKPRVVLVRHGTTNYNNKDTSQDRIRGHIDIPLNKEGLKEAEATGSKMAKLYPKIDLIYCSDLIRAKQTSDAINKHYDAPTVYSNFLRAWNLGIYQGQITDDVRPQMDKMIANENIKPKDGESFRTFKENYLRLLKKIIEIAKKHNETIVVVSHLRNCRVAEAWVAKGMSDDFEIDKKVMMSKIINPGEIYFVPLK